MKAVKSTYGTIGLRLDGETPRDAEVSIDLQGFGFGILTIDQFHHLMQAGRMFESGLSASLFDHNANPPAWENEGVKS